MTNWSEASVTINGVKLTDAQSMTLRVALTDFHERMADPDCLGEDDHGRRMVAAYRKMASEMLSIMASFHGGIPA